MTASRRRAARSGPAQQLPADAGNLAGTGARGELYVVATPLGNLGDLTARARDTLAQADLIAAEDTRVTAVLLAHCGIVARVTALHEHNERQKTPALLAELAAGRRVALVSDAGTPAISDPGARLVRAAREAGYRVVPIPGPSALTTALSAGGLDAGEVLFAGFLPAAAKARRETIERVGRLPCALAFYEAPHRVRATVEALAATLDPARLLVVARELTKIYETIAAMPLADASAWFAADANRERGEFVLLVDAPVAVASAPALPIDADRLLDALLAELPPAKAARVAAAATGLSRDELYARAVARKGG
jgi:16S rRNA (cytidine1402-2'-O)-methyltransferase